MESKTFLSLPEQFFRVVQRLPTAASGLVASPAAGR
jgi:hypothetical protein